jgi:hypothetical protein
MRLPIAAALALIAPSSLLAQTAIADLSTATPLAGNWSYKPIPNGSEATFADTAGNPQLWVNCTRTTRRVTVAKPAGGAAPFLNVWTSSLTRNVPASFSPATMRLTIDLGAYDPLFDAIASSRGRVGFAVGAQPALIVPPWAEAARVVEDCRV